MTIRPLEDAEKWNTRGFKQANSMGGGKAEIFEKRKAARFPVDGTIQHDRLRKGARTEITLQ